MIVLNFNLQHPWQYQFKNIWSRSWQTWVKHKFIEMEVYSSRDILSFTFVWTVRQDHAGIGIELGMLGRGWHFKFYDNRHWDYNANQYYTHSEQGTL